MYAAHVKCNMAILLTSLLFVFEISFLPKYRVNYYDYVTPFGLLSGVKPHLKWRALVIPYSGNPKVRYDIVFSFGPFYINKNHFFTAVFADFKGWFWGESPTPNLPAIHFRDTDGTSNQPMGSNILALLTWITVLGSRSICARACVHPCMAGMWVLLCLCACMCVITPTLLDVNNRVHEC